MEPTCAPSIAAAVVCLHGVWPSDSVAVRCRIPQAELRGWAAGRTPARNAAPTGTVEWLRPDATSRAAMKSATADAVRVREPGSP